MPKFRWSKDAGSSWTVVDAALPYNISGVVAGDTVLVEPIGTAQSISPGQETSAFRGLTSVLSAGVSDASLLWLGTSLSNSYAGWTGTFDEHIALLAKYFAAEFPAYAVGSALWTATDSGSVGAWQSQAALDGVTAGTSTFSDTFDRADGSVGTSSGGGTYNTSTSWAISGNKLVCSSASNLLNPSASPASANQIVDFDYVHGTDTTASNGCRVYTRYTSTSNSLYIGIAHNGVITLTYTVPTAANLASVSIGRSLVAGDTVHFKIATFGRFVRADVTVSGVSYSLGAYLTTTQQSTLTGTKWAISFPGSIYTGKTGDNLAVTTVSNTRLLTIFNASVPGASITYVRTNLAGIVAGLPSAPTLIGADSGYNEGTADVATYHSRLDGLRADLATSYPGVPVGLFMEMPVGTGAANYPYHDARVISIPDYARLNGLSWIDAWTGYSLSNTLPDQIHPNADGSAFIAGRDAYAFDIPAL